jgi:hypothetical protein
MAKDKGKKDKSEKTEDKAEKKAAAPEFKYGVADVAEKLGIEPASVRVQLRNRKIEKAGKSYGWNSKSELDEVVSQLKAKPEGKAEGGKKSKKAKGDDAGAADAAAEDTGGKKSKKDKKKSKKSDD